jgi:hypothetical protein
MTVFWNDEIPSLVKITDVPEVLAACVTGVITRAATSSIMLADFYQTIRRNTVSDLPFIFC